MSEEFFTDEEAVIIFKTPFVLLCESLHDLCISENHKKEERTFEFEDCIFKLSCEMKGDNDAE